MPADRRSDNPDAAAAAYWRSVATMSEATERAQNVETAAQDDRGEREVERARTVVADAAEQERVAQRIAASGGSPAAARRMRRRL